MTIAVPSTKASFVAPMDPRFGRSPFFVVYDVDTFSHEAFQNPYASDGKDAGVHAAELMAKKGAKFVLTGNCGPDAHEALSLAGIGVIEGCSGSVYEVAEQFRSGQLDTASDPNADSGFGLTVAANSNRVGGSEPDPYSVAHRHGNMDVVSTGVVSSGSQRSDDDIDKNEELAVLRRLASHMREQIHRIEDLIGDVIGRAQRPHVNSKTVGKLVFLRKLDDAMMVQLDKIHERIWELEDDEQQDYETQAAEPHQSHPAFPRTLARWVRPRSTTASRTLETVGAHGGRDENTR